MKNAVSVSYKNQRVVTRITAFGLRVKYLKCTRYMEESHDQPATRPLDYEDTYKQLICLVLSIRRK